MNAGIRPMPHMLNLSHGAKCSLWPDQGCWVSFILVCFLFVSFTQAYNSMGRPYPRRFVLPLSVDAKKPVGQNLSPLSYTSAAAVKEADGKVHVFCVRTGAWEAFL